MDSVFSIPVVRSVDPLTIHTIIPALALQLKVAVDPSVALTDVGVLTKAEIQNNEIQNNKTTIKLASESLTMNWDTII